MSTPTHEMPPLVAKAYAAARQMTDAIARVADEKQAQELHHEIMDIVQGYPAADVLLALAAACTDSVEAMEGEFTVGLMAVMTIATQIHRDNQS